MPKATLVCLEADDLLHENSGEPNFNESAYYNFYDPQVRLGGFVRIGNRANEGHAEMTLCLYLPDGTVSFMYGRPTASEQRAGHNVLAAGPMRFEVKTPLREHAIRYDGKGCMLARPRDLFDPRKAFTENPHKPVTVELAYTGLSPVAGGEPRTQVDGEWVSVKSERAGQEFARGHLEQHGHAVGKVVVDGVEYPIDGYGLRDRSWGPRYWQAPDYYRWLTMNFGADAGIAGALTVQRDGSRVQGGYLWTAGEPNRHVTGVEVDTDYDADQLHTKLRAHLTLADGSHEDVEGRVLNMVPLRNRREGVTTRIAEGLTEWRWGDRVGYGWSEYLDHVD